MIADYHVHTNYSDDSSYPMEQVVLDAISLGINELCFTDHVDYGIKNDQDIDCKPLFRHGGINEPEWIPLTNVNYPEYVKEIAHLKEKYKDQIILKLGLEFGVQRHTIAKYESLFKRYLFDFIILSVHEIDDKEFWNQEYQKGKTQDEYVMNYYKELLYLVKHYHDYSVLGHLDLIARYDVKGNYPFDKVKPIITEILNTVIKDGKGIELNTSSHRYCLKDLTPSLDILKLYHDLGGKIITIGSDSHKPEHLGAYIEESKEVLKQIGFSEFCTFEQMHPVFHIL